MTAAIETVPWRRFAIASLFALVLGVSMLVMPASRAEAQSNVGIGLGVSSGLKLLNDLSKGTTTKKKGKSTASKKTTKKKTTTSKKKDGGKSKQDDDESADDTAAADDGKAKAEGEKAPAATATAPAASGTAALAATGVATAAKTGADATPISSKSEIKSAQEHLKFMGYDVPELNGTLDLKTKIAMMQFQDSIGETSSGVLTVKQLQTLFVKVAEKTAKAK